MVYSTTDEIQAKLDYDQYQEQFTKTMKQIAHELNEIFNADEIDIEKIRLFVIEQLNNTNDIYLTHPISVIKHSNATLSTHGAERLGEVTNTEDFAHEHARDLLNQEIIDSFESILVGKTIADVQLTNTAQRGNPVFTISE